MKTKDDLLTPALLKVMVAAWTLGASGSFSSRALYQAVGKDVNFSTINKELCILTERGYLTRETSSEKNPGSAAWEYFIAVNKDEYMARSNALYLQNHYGEVSEVSLLQFARDLQIPK